MTVDDLITEILEREGGFVNHKDDRGGPTKYGITKGTLARWRGRHVTVDDVKALDIGEARDIYRSQYVSGPGFESLPEPLRSHVVDFGVNAGPHMATKTLQRVVGVKDDGVLGPQTRAALASADIAEVTRRFWQERIRYYGHLVALRPANATFLDGWLNRCFAMWPQG
jgi:lysozyme family protein